ncbi:MAG: glycyl-radical enzyme activating protein, partial [Actinomycetota bacterium]
QNPESQAVRPVTGFYADRCTESFECVAVCPSGAIRLEGYRVDHDLCEQCGLCVEACAYDALKVIGESLTPEELMEKLLADRPYYDSSGGGVTFTGGEPTLHHAFLERVLALCAEAGIHTNIETSGTFPWVAWESTLRIADLIYFDLKILDAQLHREHLGGGFDRIMENAGKLASGGFPVEFRMAAIPGFTDTPTNVDAVIALLRDLGHERIHLLAYHNMGEAKIDIIEGNQPKLGLERYSDERWDELVEVFTRQGIEVLQSA